MIQFLSFFYRKKSGHLLRITSVKVCKYKNHQTTLKLYPCKLGLSILRKGKVKGKDFSEKSLLMKH
ncbi:MAG: hypothetical protein ACI9EW_003118 [Cellvibrionaceae bacterium]|jgi:hypothetical protein